MQYFHQNHVSRTNRFFSFFFLYVQEYLFNSLITWKLVGMFQGSCYLLFIHISFSKLIWLWICINNKPRLVCHERKSYLSHLNKISWRVNSFEQCILEKSCNVKQYMDSQKMVWSRKENVRDICITISFQFFFSKKHPVFWP